MRRRIHSICLIVTLLTAAVVGAVRAQGGRLWVEPDTMALAPGDEGTVEIWVAGVSGLAGAEIHLTFDQQLLQVVDAEAEVEGVQIAHGGFLPADFVVQNSADQAKGTIDYAIACNPVSRAVSGSGVLARVTFQAAAEGETWVDIRSALLADAGAQPIAVETDPSVIVVRRPGPSPAVWTLIGMVAIAVTAGFCVVLWRTFKAS